MRRYLEPILRKAIERIGGTSFQLGPAGGEGHGDMSTSVALKLARELGESPLEIAERIVAALEVDPRSIDRVEIVAPGFINVHFTPGFFQSRLAEVLALRERYGHVDASSALRAAARDIFGIDPSREGAGDDPLRAVRYARGQIAGLLRHAAREGLTPAPDASLDCLTAPEELDLIRAIILYPEHAERAAPLADPVPLAGYLHDLAAAFNRFNQTHRIIADPAPRAARLRLLMGAGIIIDNALGLLGLA